MISTTQEHALLSHELAQPLLRRELGRETEQPRLSIIIVNYCQWRDTGRLVRQIRKAACVRQGAVEIMIVDNDSPPHPLVARLRRQRSVSLRRWGRNRGFAKAVNEGCRLSQGKWLMLLNPDVTLEADFIDGVLAKADRLEAEDPRAGIVGFHLRNSDGSHQLSSGTFPTFLGTLAGLAKPRARRKYRRISTQGRVPWVTGCCLLARRECMREIGNLDEDYFLYYEDVDLCRRARAHGWTVWYEPALRLVHHHPLQSRTVTPKLRICTRHGLLTYASKHWPNWQFLTLAKLVRIEAWLKHHRSAWQGDGASADLFAEMGSLAREMADGKPSAARRRLERVMASAPILPGSKFRTASPTTAASTAPPRERCLPL